MTKCMLAAGVLVFVCAAGPASYADDAAKPAAAGGPSKPAPGDVAKPAAGEAQEAAARDASPVAAVIDKAAEALGGKDKLAALKAATWSSKGTLTLGGADTPFTAKLVYAGADRRRIEFDADFGGNPIKAVVVVNGDKGWRKVNDATEELTGDELDRERRAGFREWTPVAVLLLKSPPFKTEAAGDDTVDGKPAIGVKVTGPAGGPFTLYFDKGTGLPVKQVATVPSFAGGEATEETTYSDYKDFGGVKKATKVEAKHDGQRLIQAELTEFKVIDSPEAGTFERPE